MPDGIRCTRCSILKRACPRLVDFYIKRIARRLARSEEYVGDLYSQYGTKKRPGGAGGLKPSQVTRGGLGKPKGAVTESNHGEFIIIEEEEVEEVEEVEEAEEEDGIFELDRDEASRGNRIHVLRSQPKTTKVSDKGLTNRTHHQEAAVMDSDHKNELLLQKKEIQRKALFYFFQIHMNVMNQC